ncbi:hypothetical protein GOODEAATRI_022584, partial [Goodea atripinnis]
SNFSPSICLVSMGRAFLKRSSRLTASNTFTDHKHKQTGIFPTQQHGFYFSCCQLSCNLKAHLEFLLVGGADHRGNHIWQSFPGQTVQQASELGHHWDRRV